MMKFATAVMAVFLLSASQAFAHSWYDAYCCSDKDCEPLPSGAVSMVEGGYRVQYLSFQGNVIDQFVPFDKVRPSQDGQDHACEINGQLRCLYVAVTA